MTAGLGQSDHADLSAYLDSELPEPRAAEVSRLIREASAWEQAYREMTAVDAALEGWTAPEPPAGLAERVLAHVASSELSPGDFEQLSAYVDGELPPSAAAEVAARIQDSPLWRRSHEQVLATDAALDACTVPAPPVDLADRIVARTNRAARRSRVLRVAAWAGSAAAAAAALLIAFALLNNGHGTGTGPDPHRPVIAKSMQQEIKASSAFRDVPQDQRGEWEEVVVEHYNVEEVQGFFRDFDVAAEFETLEAIERLENEGT